MITTTETEPYTSVRRESLTSVFDSGASVSRLVNATNFHPPTSIASSSNLHTVTTTNFDILIEMLTSNKWDRMPVRFLVHGAGSQAPGPLTNSTVVKTSAPEELEWGENPENALSGNSGAGNYVLDQLAAEYPGAANRLITLRKLQPDWDGFGGSPPSEKAVVATASLVIMCQSLANRKLLQPFIAPLPDGGLQIEWESVGGAELTLVVPPGGIDVRFLLDIPLQGGQMRQSEGTVPVDASVSDLIRAFTHKEKA